MEERTRRHLARARRNRDVADALIGPRARSIIDPPPREWAVVAAFYSAVHYVNAYLWEKRRQEPSNHDHRRRLVAQESDLRRMSQSYGRLRALAFLARYADLFSPAESEIHGAVQTDLRAVERALNVAPNV